MSSWFPPAKIFMEHRPFAEGRQCAGWRQELCVFEASSLKRRGLALCNAIDRKILYGFVEQLIEIQLGAQVQEHGAEPDRGAIHEDEFTRHFHRALLLEGLMDAEGLAAAVLGWLHAIGD